MTPGPDEAPSPFRRPGFILAAGFLTVIILLGVLVAMTRGGSGGSPGSTNPPPTGRQSGAAGGTNSAACQPADTNQQVPTTAPPGVTWELFQAIALPVSPNAGPLIRKGDIRSCYAHTPTGALIAAAQISARITYSSNWRAISEQQLTNSAGKAVFLKDRATHGANPPLQAGDVAQYAGFKFITYGPDTAVISLANRIDSTAWIASTATVKWQGDDWKLELQSDGSPSTEGQQLASLDGYIRWGGA
ncbi:hypothetical protein [Actinomadura napierensis]|uniref:DUF8175 domain-containing protein n=1 Tax=Actinomadura napierensis TaxID=267854 RepID=A0ABN2ZWP3_9ACTN